MAKAKKPTHEQVIEQIARVAHEANRGYCAGLGDSSQPAWSKAPAWQKSSAVNGVRFHLDNPGAGPVQSHNNWRRQKAADGWKFGRKKDPEKKRHPCMVPYEQLPVEQRLKDSLFIAVVRALAPMLAEAEG